MTDDRVPGRNQSRTKEYVCGRCGAHEQDTAKPRTCVNDHAGSMREVRAPATPAQQEPGTQTL